VKYKIKPEVFILDLDGVLSDGKFYYSDKGKIMKVFSVDDHDALDYLGRFLKIQVISADSKGIKISKRRIENDMGLSLELVPAQNRVEWLSSRFDLTKAIYMGDGIFDFLVFKEVMYSISPSSALFNTKKNADFVTKSKSGERAVAEACIKILEVFFQKHNIFH
jgi:3-deoxy-D-manno-octulosonate 8-phosphate phosphatase (KDO 8-P phosphatase)